jgi:hypothetical protein
VKERPILLGTEWVRATIAGRKTQTRRPVNLNKVDHRVNWIGFRIGDHGAAWYAAEILAATAEDHARLANESRIRCPIGEIGDRLWVREVWSPIGDTRPSGYWTDPAWTGRDIWYEADDDKPTWGGAWRPKIHMKREHSRITLIIEDIVSERLHEMRDEDVIAEGVPTAKGEGTGPGPGLKWRGLGFNGCYPGLYHVPNGLGLCACNRVCPPKKEGHYHVPLSPGLCAFRERWDQIYGRRGYPWELNPWVWVCRFRVAEVRCMKTLEQLGINARGTRT